MDHWKFLKSIENIEKSQGNNGFWTPNKAATLTYKIPCFKALKSEQHKSGYNLEMKFCNLFLILWEQVSYYSSYITSNHSFNWLIIGIN